MHLTNDHYNVFSNITRKHRKVTGVHLKIKKKCYKNMISTNDMYLLKLYAYFEILIRNLLHDCVFGFRRNRNEYKFYSKIPILKERIMFYLIIEI